MIICRTPDIKKLGSKFIKAKPLTVLLWVLIALILCAGLTTAIITSGNPRTVSWIFLAIMTVYNITLCTQASRADSYFNAFVVNDKGKLVFINFGGIFMNDTLFGGQYHTTGKLRIFVDWFKAAGKMKKFQNEKDFDAFVTSDSVLSLGHYVEKVFSVKSSKKYIVAKLRLKQCNAVQSNILTEFTKTIRIPKSFENSQQLEYLLLEKANQQK